MIFTADYEIKLNASIVYRDITMCIIGVLTMLGFSWYGYITVNCSVIMIVEFWVLLITAILMDK